MELLRTKSISRRPRMSWTWLTFLYTWKLLPARKYKPSILQAEQWGIYTYITALALYFVTSCILYLFYMIEMKTDTYRYHCSCTIFWSAREYILLHRSRTVFCHFVRSLPIFYDWNEDGYIRYHHSRTIFWSAREYIFSAFGAESRGGIIVAPHVYTFTMWVK